MLLSSAFTIFAILAAACFAYVLESSTMPAILADECTYYYLFTSPAILPALAALMPATVWATAAFLPLSAWDFDSAVILAAWIRNLVDASIALLAAMRAPPRAEPAAASSTAVASLLVYLVIRSTSTPAEPLTSVPVAAAILPPTPAAALFDAARAARISPCPYADARASTPSLATNRNDINY